MFDFFFYGTLVDADVRQMVLGREVPDTVVEPASLSGFQRYSVLNQPYPAAVPQKASTTDGVVAPGLSVNDAAKLTCFEGADYEAWLVQVELLADGRPEFQDAWVFIASERVQRGDPQWSIDDWRTRHKPAFLNLAGQWLDGISDADIEAAEQFWRERSSA